MIDPALVLPVHYDDYTVMKSPLGDFLDEAERRGFRSRLVHCPRGSRVVVGPGAKVNAVAADARQGRSSGAG
jgi:hypothetical protein